MKDWVLPAFEVFVKWTKQPQATIPEDSDIDSSPIENHLRLWELGRELQAPAFQNAVMKNLIYLTDFYEEVTAADMLWLYSRIADDDEFESFDDHKMFKFCLDVVTFEAPEELWKDVIRQGGDLAVMVAEDVFEDDTDEKGNLVPGRRDFDPTNSRYIHLYLETEGWQHAEALENDSEYSEIYRDHIGTFEAPENFGGASSHSRAAVQGRENSEQTNNNIPITIDMSTNHDDDFESGDDLCCLLISESEGCYGIDGEEGPV